MPRRNTIRVILSMMATIMACGGNDEVRCPAPTAELSFGTGEPCTLQNYNRDVSGVFTNTADGFRVDDGMGGSLSITGLTAAIPDGTLVRALHLCVDGGWTGVAQSVQIDNVPFHGGMANPTEDGARLWLVAAGGGLAPLPDTLPFTLREETVCRVPGEKERGYFIEVQRLTVSGEDFSVTAEPQQNAIFTIGIGVHAGAYELRNVQVVVTGPLEAGETRMKRNFSITRAD